MRVRTLGLLVFLLAFARAGAADSSEDAAKQADADLKIRVNRAIDRGANWLLDQQSANGAWADPHNTVYPMGPTALCLLALLHSDVPAAHPKVEKGFDWLRKACERVSRQGGNPFAGRGLKTYSVSVTIMALAEWGRRGALSSEDRAWLRKLTAWLVGQQQSQGGWRYPGGGNDVSNTQYAALALQAARRAGVKVDDRVFVGVLEYFLSEQASQGKRVPRHEESGGDGVYAAQRERVSGYDRERGWGYMARMPATGSMTTAGVASVAICVGELSEKRWRSRREKGEQSVRDGLAWLGANFSVTANPNAGAAWHYYYLYGLERAGVLAGVVHMGRHRWYAEGARYLVDEQAPAGAWRPVSIVDHCFALLFLTRATARGGTVTEPPRLNLRQAAKLPDREARDLFRAAFAELLQLDEATVLERAPEFAFLGPRVIGYLIPLLHDPGRRERFAAAFVLRAITGEEHGYDSAASAAEREDAADAWTAWYLSRRGTLTLDPDARRLR
jgi:hypothetical protein